MAKKYAMIDEEVIEFAKRKAKKEVFDDIDKQIREETGKNISRFKELKKKHLGEQ